MVFLETGFACGHIRFRTAQPEGEVVEWFMAPVLKTGLGKPNVGSNPTLSAMTPLPFARVG